MTRRTYGRLWGKRLQHKQRPRRLSFQVLTRREMLAGDLHNPYLPQDVNNDLVVTPSDILEVIAFVSEQRFMPADSPVDTLATTQSIFPDVDNNGVVSPGDILSVINQIVEEPDSYVMRLANDTAPNETTNHDRITSDATIEGKINWPVDSDPLTRRAKLVSVDHRGEEVEIDLAEFTQGDSFSVNHNEVNDRLRILTYTFGSREREVGLQIEVDEAAIDFPVPKLNFTVDRELPEVQYPDSLGTAMTQLPITIIGTSDLTDESFQSISATTAISNEDISEGLDREVAIRKTDADDYWLIDVGIDQLTENTDGAVSLKTHGYLEDIAGNKLILDDAFLWWRTGDERDREFGAIDLASIRPESGMAFDTTIASANPGQVITIPLLKDGSTDVLVPVAASSTEGDAEVGLTHRAVPLRLIDHLRGTGQITLPSDFVSGLITTEVGDVLLSIAAVPVHYPYSYYYRRGGSYINNGESSFRYRTLTEEQFHQIKNDGSDGSVRREDTLTWASLSNDSPLTRNGFQFLQLAGPDGVSQPVLLQELDATDDKISVVAQTSDFQAAWIGSRGRLIRAQLDDGSQTAVVDQQSLYESLRGQGQGEFLDDSFLVEALQVVPGDHLQGSVIPVGDAEIVAGDEYLVIWIEPEHSSQRAWVVDAENGLLIGFLRPEITGGDAESDFLSVVRDLKRSTWIRFTSDLSRWQEISSDGSQVLTDATPSGMPTYRVNGTGFGYKNRLSWARTVRWNPSLEQVELFSSGRNINPGALIVSNRSSFNADTGQFERTTAGYASWPDVSSTPFIPPASKTELRIVGDSGLRRVVRFDAVPRPPTVVPSINSIHATATIGAPADTAVPSSNVGQFVEVRGVGLTDKSRLVFQTNGRTSSNLRSLASVSVTDSKVSPSWVADDGSSATYKVPIRARTGQIGLEDAESRYALQIVPHFVQTYPRRAIPDRVPRIDQTTVAGIAGNQFRLWADSQLVAGCLDESLLGNCKHFVPAPRYGGAYQSLELETLGGRHRIDVLTKSPESRTGQIGDFVEHVPTRGTAFQYTGLQSQQVQAGSLVNFTVVRDESEENEERPRRVQIKFLVPYGNQGQLRVFPNSYEAVHVEGDEYRMRLPLNFPGGWVVLSDQIIATQQQADELALKIDVVPTVVAAVGDSTLTGANVLLNGTNLSAATILIDDQIVTAEIIASALEFDKGETVRIVVPPNVSNGTITVRRGGVLATLGVLSPWWLEGQMPVAEGGTPRFADLPSANRFQEIDYAQAGVAADDIPLSNRTIFGKTSSPLLHLLPIVPSSNAPVVWTPEFSQRPVEAFAFAVHPSDEFTIEWGEDQWHYAEYRKTRLYSEIEGALGSSAKGYRTYLLPTNDDDETPKLLYLGTARHFGFFASDLNQRSPDALRVFNQWGSFFLNETKTSQIDSEIQSLQSHHGTPADPTMPSVNPGQKLDPQYNDLNYFASSTGVFASDYYKTLDYFEVPDGIPGGLVQVRHGLYGDYEPLQVVPSVDVYAINRKEGFEVKILGIDDTASIKIGEQVFALTESEIADSRVRVELTDPRFAAVSKSDVMDGVSVVTLGGASQIVSLELR